MVIKRLIASKGETDLHNLLLKKYEQSKPQRVHLKVRLADVFDVDDNRWSSEEKSFIFKSHFDFIITQGDGTPQVAVEFDSTYHDTPEAKRRDALKNQICHKANFEILRLSSKDIISSASLSHSLDLAESRHKKMNKRRSSLERLLYLNIAIKSASANLTKSKRSVSLEEIVKLANDLVASNFIQVSNEDADYFYSNADFAAHNDDLEEALPESSITREKYVALASAARIIPISLHESFQLDKLAQVLVEVATKFEQYLVGARG